jgi:hypothetical protein
MSPIGFGPLRILRTFTAEPSDQEALAHGPRVGVNISDRCHGCQVGNLIVSPSLLSGILTFAADPFAVRNAPAVVG